MKMGDHLFISYATQDAALADWLTLKLTAYGYKVWCDRFKLLGGESFPRDIDIAIKRGAFRLLALISKASLDKENPTKERTLALNIGRERHIDFLIPLKVESLSPTELGWMLSDLTYIPFDKGWAQGLGQLLRKLEKIEAPRPLANGKEIASNSIFCDDLVKAKQEKLHTNIIRVTRIPDVIHRFKLDREPNPYDNDQIAGNWPVYPITSRILLSFHSPPKEIESRLGIKKAGGSSWPDSKDIVGINSLNIVSHLLRLVLDTISCQKGLRVDKETGVLHFPSGLLKGNKTVFRSYDGRKTSVLVVGQRRKFGSKYRYHVGPEFSVRRNLVDQFCVLMRVRIFITDQTGKALSRRSALSSRKHLCKNWWNEHWLKRQLAIMQYLSDGQGEVGFGIGQERVSFSAVFDTFEAGFGIDETLLSRTRIEEEHVLVEQLRDEEYQEEQEELEP